MKWIVLALLFYSLSEANAFKLPRSVANANVFVDEFIELLGPWMKQHHLDPFYTKALNEHFWFEWLWVNYTGDIYLRDIDTYQLSTLTRDGDAIVTYKNKTLTIDIAAQVEKLIIKSKFTANIMGLHPEGHQTAKISKQKISMTIVCDVCTLKLFLKEFVLKKNKDMDIELEGSGLAGFLNLFIDAFASLYSEQILGSLSTLIHDLVQEKLDSMKPILPPATECRNT